MRPVVRAARQVIVHSRRAPAQAVPVEHRGLIIQDEAGVFISDLERVGRVRAILELVAAAPARDGERGVNAHHLVHSVEPMCPIIGGHAAGIIPEPSVCDGIPVFVEGDCGRGTKVKIPVEPRRRSRVRRATDAVGRHVQIIPHAHKMHGAKFA